MTPGAALENVPPELCVSQGCDVTGVALCSVSAELGGSVIVPTCTRAGLEMEQHFSLELFFG